MEAGWILSQAAEYATATIRTKMNEMHILLGRAWDPYMRQVGVGRYMDPAIQ